MLPPPGLKTVREVLGKMGRALEKQELREGEGNMQGALAPAAPGEGWEGILESGWSNHPFYR